MYQDHKDLLSAFHAHGVKYLIVGGFAVIFLANFGAPLDGMHPENFAERGSFFRFRIDPHGFDILPSIPGVDFDTAWEKRVEGKIARGL